MPFLAGERSIGYHEKAKVAVLGLTQSASAVEITQAAMEAVVFRLAENYEQLQELVNINTIIASGGALRESPVWTQTATDTLGQNLRLPDTHEALSRGVMLLALESLGKIDDLAKLPKPEGTEFYFDQKRHETYREARKRHEYFYQ